MSNHLNPILLVGAGNMGREYAKVLLNMKQPFDVFTRSEKTANQFQQLVGKKAEFGDFNELIKKGTKYNQAIVAVSVEHLKEVAIFLMKNGVNEILMEKPGALNTDELKEIKLATLRFNGQVYIGYNRRFYESVQKLLSFITEENSIQSLHFDFTEISKRVEKSKSSTQVKNKWLLANSSHVIDLAFFLAGTPISMQCYSKSQLSWHPDAAIFTGSGVAENDVLFSYHSNWKAPGRWGIEVMTDQFKFILKPLEKLFVMKHGSFKIEEIHLQNDRDNNFKPGLYNQIQSFLNDKRYLVSLVEQIEKVNQIYTPILLGQNHD
jgi:predicted dehydrogenase